MLFPPFAPSAFFDEADIDALAAEKIASSAAPKWSDTMAGRNAASGTSSRQDQFCLSGDKVARMPMA
jgi:hypothetical protein